MLEINTLAQSKIAETAQTHILHILHGAHLHAVTNKTLITSFFF